MRRAYPRRTPGAMSFSRAAKPTRNSYTTPYQTEKSPHVGLNDARAAGDRPGGSAAADALGEVGAEGGDRGDPRGGRGGLLQAAHQGAADDDPVGERADLRG